METVAHPDGKRKYQAIWEQLKAEGYLQLESPRASHKTIMRALRKESVNDSMFRFNAVEVKHQSYQVGYNSVGDLLFIRLEWKDTIPDNFTYKAPRGKKSKIN